MNALKATSNGGITGIIARGGKKVKSPKESTRPGTSGSPMIKPITPVFLPLFQQLQIAGSLLLRPGDAKALFSPARRPLEKLSLGTAAPFAFTVHPGAAQRVTKGVKTARDLWKVVNSTLRG